MKRFSAILASGVVVALLLAGWSLWGPSDVPAGQPLLVTLTPENFAQLQARFNDSPDGVRVVVLLSPT